MASVAASLPEACPGQSLPEPATPHPQQPAFDPGYDWSRILLRAPFTRVACNRQQIRAGDTTAIGLSRKALVRSPGRGALLVEPSYLQAPAVFHFPPGLVRWGEQGAQVLSTRTKWGGGGLRGLGLHSIGGQIPPLAPGFWVIQDRGSTMDTAEKPTETTHRLVMAGPAKAADHGCAGGGVKGKKDTPVQPQPSPSKKLGAGDTRARVCPGGLARGVGVRHTLQTQPLRDSDLWLSTCSRGSRGGAALTQRPAKRCSSKNPLLRLLQKLKLR